ncbi:hypothetical protein AJ79_05148 [Helicocarpus griseus UAMH5409]|uniref:MARVEL domain-containing protein n=1 Tax=Helicocarpus griseus UAMH5409 TaxID=1447875 RepID=A0A2B7XR64_9EURO|nr:hypothetical protein AJ79_05148 [Helicocarpus griseus UAMH5409]
MLVSYRTFLALRITALLVSITGTIGMAWATSVLWSPDMGWVVEAVATSALGVSALWSLTALIIGIKVDNERIHPAFYVSCDLIFGLYAIVGGIMTLMSPFTELSWIKCGGDSWTSICDDDAENRAVIWRFFATAFNFINAIICAVFHITACKAVHRLRKAKKSDDIELSKQ